MIPSSPYCPDCPRRYRPLGGDGPQPADVLIVGERPGRDENRKGQVFIGKTGEELNKTYLPMAGWTRKDVRVCNTVRCWADNNRTPTEKEIANCAKHHLPAELIKTEPRVVVLMGGSACQLVKGIRLDTHHGIPRLGKLFDWEGVIVPMYHPALGLHESKWMTQLIEDWQNLPSELQSEMDNKAVSSAAVDYCIIRGKEIRDVPLASVVAIDTESHGAESFSVQVSSTPGHAYMVLAQDRQDIALLAGRLRHAEGVFHHAVHDLDELQRLGIYVDSVRDTMQEAYHLGDLPQGLKPLVYRLFRFTMTSWEDVVRPYSIEALIVWLVEALDIAQNDLSLTDVERYKKPYKGKLTKETVKKCSLESLICRLIQHVDSTGGYDPWSRLREFWAEEGNEWMVSHIEARIGRFPILGIGNAPINRAVQYACGDADWTGQAAKELERRRRDSYWRIDKSDVDR